MKLATQLRVPLDEHLAVMRVTFYKKKRKSREYESENSDMEEGWVQEYLLGRGSTRSNMTSGKKNSVGSETSSPSCDRSWNGLILIIGSLMAVLFTKNPDR